MLLIEKMRTRPASRASRAAPTKWKRSFSRKSAAAVGKSRSGCPQSPYETIGMCCPRIGLCQPAISRRSPFPIRSLASRSAGPRQSFRRRIPPLASRGRWCHSPEPFEERCRMERIPIVENGREVSHLAVRFDPPPQGTGERPCFLYLHGFGSEQSGEKAEFFRARAQGSGFGFCSFDFQGHGLSGGDMLGLTLTRNLEDVGRVHAFLRDRGCGRLLLLGSSMGGGTALW